jgi:hypothetical protein
VTALLAGEVIYADKLDLGRATSRERFTKAMLAKTTTLDRAAIEAELLHISEEAARPAASSPSDGELDLSRIVRPELFHLADLSGISVPSVALVGGRPVGRWWMYLSSRDGQRRRSELAERIILPDDKPMWVNPVPAAPDVMQAAATGWTTEARSAWLDGADPPDAALLLQRLCDAVAHYLDFPRELAAGHTALLSIWTMLTYAYPCWPAVPYLSVGGPLGSGKSRVFELLARLVFRPLVSANLTAPTLFRTLHEQGGILLLDEAERLRENTPDAGELRSILLAGYKQGSPAMRLEPAGDGKFIRRTFNVYGPKAIAGIGGLPEVLASRCIRVNMLRSSPDSDKPRRRLDDDPSLWANLRDDLHALALECGPVWLQLSNRADVCGLMSGRDFELWQPVLALAAWLDELGADGLLGLMQDHAGRLIDANRDDAVPDVDEVLLRLLADAVLQQTHAGLSPEELLRQAQQREPNLFTKWTTRGVSSTLKRYGLQSTKCHGRRTYRDVSLIRLAEIERAYGLDLGLPAETRDLCG